MVYYNKIPLYPIFYLLQGSYRIKGFGLGILFRALYLNIQVVIFIMLMAAVVAPVTRIQTVVVGSDGGGIKSGRGSSGRNSGRYGEVVAVGDAATTRRILVVLGLEVCVYHLGALLVFLGRRSEHRTIDGGVP